MDKRSPSPHLALLWTLSCMMSRKHLASSSETLMGPWNLGHIHVLVLWMWTSIPNDKDVSQSAAARKVQQGYDGEPQNLLIRHEDAWKEERMQPSLLTCILHRARPAPGDAAPLSNFRPSHAKSSMLSRTENKNIPAAQHVQIVSPLIMHLSSYPWF